MLNIHRIGKLVERAVRHRAEELKLILDLQLRGKGRNFAGLWEGNVDKTVNSETPWETTMSQIKETIETLN